MSEKQLEMRESRRQVMRLAWPSVMENMAATLVSFVDSAMVGSLGAAATAAVGVCQPPMWLIGGIVASFGVGGTALVARMIGARDMDGAKRVCRQAALCGLLLSVFMMVLCLFGAPLIPVLMRAEQNLHTDATAYFRIYSLCFIPYFTSAILSALLRGAGDTKTPMVAGLVSNLLNVVLNFFLIYSTRTVTLFGLEMTMWGAGLGVRGAAAASALAMTASGVYIFFRMQRKKSALRLSFAHENEPLFNGDIIKRIVRIGAPTALERAAINLGQITFAGMVSAIGTVEYAAHSLAITVEGLGYMPGHGFAAAATTLVGQYLGANDYPKARELGKRAILMATAVMSVMGVAMFVFAPQLISMFTPDPKVREVGAMLLRICAFEQPFSALSIAGSGALHGAGDTKMPFVYSLLTMWGVRIVMAWLLGTVCGFGVAGIWWAMVLDLMVRGFLLYGRFLRGKWRNAKV